MEVSSFNRIRAWRWLLPLAWLTVQISSAIAVETNPPPPAATTVSIGEFTPSNCPPIPDTAFVTAKIVAADSGAPDTQHPGIDLWVRTGPATNVIRIHFGDPGDGTNTCLTYDDCRNMEELPISVTVKTAAVRALLAELKLRHCRIGKFISWGVPVWPWGAHGSNCGDAFVATLVHLGIHADVLPRMRRWAKENHKGKWAFDRGRRRPRDSYFAGINSRGEDPHLAFRGPPALQGARQH